MRFTRLSLLIPIAIAFPALAGIHPFHAALSASDPVLWYRLDEAPGTTLYVNGVAVPLEVDNALPGAPVIDVTATTFRIQRATDGARHFSGVVDELALYDRALSPAEVQAHFDSLTLGVLTCPADFNRDGRINGADLGILLGAWSPPGAGCGTAAAADLNCDCLVDGADLGILLGAWGPSD